MKRYYDENWPSLILICCKFKDPSIANLEVLTSYLHHPDSSDPNKIMYFYVDFIPPGKNYFVVKHNQEEIQEEEEEKPQPKKGLGALLASSLVSPKKKPKKPEET